MYLVQMYLVQMSGANISVQTSSREGGRLSSASLSDCEWPQAASAAFHRSGHRRIQRDLCKHPSVLHRAAESRALEALDRSDPAKALEMTQAAAP